MKILITGATGFVGSHVTDRLIELGHDVRALTRSSSSLKWLEQHSNSKLELVQGNMLNPETLKEAVSGVNAVIHIAGVTAAKDKRGFYDGNQGATRGLLEAVKKFNPGIERFIMASSLTACGPSLDGEPVTEITPPHPITTYGKSKRAAEEECERMRAQFPITILRLSAVYGERDSAVLTFFQTVSKGLKPLIGFRDKYVNLVHIADVVHGIELSLIRPEALNETFNIGSEDQYSWRQVSDLTARIMNKRGITIKLPHAIVFCVAGISEFVSMFQKKPSVLNFEKGKDIVQESWTCSVEKAKNLLGYRQRVSLEDGIRSTTEWYKKEGWL